MVTTTAADRLRYKLWMIRLHLVIFAIIYTVLLVKLAGLGLNDLIYGLIFAITLPTAFNILNNIWHKAYDTNRVKLSGYLTAQEVSKWKKRAYILMAIGYISMCIKSVDEGYNMIIIALIFIGSCCAYMYNRFGKTIGWVGEVFYISAYFTSIIYVLTPVVGHFYQNIELLYFIFLTLIYIEYVNFLNHLNDKEEWSKGARTIATDLHDFLINYSKGSEFLGYSIRLAIIVILDLTALSFLYLVWDEAMIASILYFCVGLLHSTWLILVYQFTSKGIIIVEKKGTQLLVMYAGRIGSSILFVIAMILHILSV